MCDVFSKYQLPAQLPNHELQSFVYLYPPEGQLGVKLARAHRLTPPQSGLSQHKHERFHRARVKNMSSPFKGKVSISVTTALRIIVCFDEGKVPVHPLFSHERNGH